MNEFEPGFVDADTWTAFDADPIAGSNLRRRFAIATSPHSPGMAMLDILSERIGAHRVARLINAKSLRWALAHDDHEIKFVVIECLGPLADVHALASELRNMRYVELDHYDRSTAKGMRRLHLPEG